MASHGTLPLYYKNSRPTGLSAGPGKSWKDNYLLLVVFMGFVVLIAGTFWFLPPLDDKDSDYEKTYGRFAGNAAITDAVVIPTEPTLVPSEEPGRRGKEEKHWEGEKEGGEGGRKEESEIIEVVKQPVQLKDLIKEDKPVQVSDKNPQPPAHGSPEISQTPQTTKPPETTRPPETTQPPASESVEVGQQSREGGNGAEPGVGEGGATDPGVEEKRRKIIEVGSIFFYEIMPLKIAEWWGKKFAFFQ